MRRSPTYVTRDYPVINGVATLIDGRRVASSARFVRVPHLIPAGQTAGILAVLRLGITLTPGEALDQFGTLRLAGRIHEAKQRLEAGESIVAEWVTTPGGARVSRYRLVVEGQAKLWPDRKRPPVMT